MEINKVLAAPVLRVSFAGLGKRVGGACLAAICPPLQQIGLVEAVDTFRSRCCEVPSKSDLPVLGQIINWCEVLICGGSKGDLLGVLTHLRVVDVHLVLHLGEPGMVVASDRADDNDLVGEVLGSDVAGKLLPMSDVVQPCINLVAEVLVPGLVEA